MTSLLIDPPLVSHQEGDLKSKTMESNEENITKECFKCHRVLPLTMFYKHPRMADGHLNKCKECIKKDVHEKYMDNIENKSYVEKERERCREKYRRLGYKDVYKHNHPETKQVAAYIKRRVSIPETHEIHHWDYNLLYDVFILDKRIHKRFHKKVLFDEESKCFLYNGELLDTKEKHEKAIREITGLSNNEEIIKFAKD